MSFTKYLYLKTRRPGLSLAFLLWSIVLFAQTPETYYFSPNYTLPRKAAQYPGNKIDPPQSRFHQFKLKNEMPFFRGEEATEVLDDFLKERISLPVTLEFSLVHHFNKPAGLVFYLKNDEAPVYSFSYFSAEDQSPVNFSFTDHIHERNIIEGTLDKYFQKYWHHFVVQLDRDSVTIYHNGELLKKAKLVVENPDFQLAIAAYLQNEPNSATGNILQWLRIYHEKINNEQINEAFENFKNQIEEGRKYSDVFHFNAGPYLNYATTSSINVLWETNKAAGATLFYGEELPLNKSIKIPDKKGEPPYIFETTIAGLKPGQPYFYNIKLNSRDGEEMESGVLTFKTAEESGRPILFGLFGDTETRPHVNDIICKKLWAERPEFVLVLGDLTDGGMKDAKWQWNLEYFEGMTQLLSRIPAFPVPGNGEGDLYWYKKYHDLPNGEAYYSFKYGNAEFFMLNSNERKKEFSPGGRQYQWLDSALEHSDAQWKFVAMHHAPYSTDEDDYGDAYKGKSNLGDPQVKPLIPLFEKHNVDAVFFGHLHTYNRMGPIRNNSYDSKNGVLYVQAGGAGGNTEDFAPTRAWFSQKNYAGHHYCTVSLDGGEFILKTYDLDGDLIDFFTMKK